MPHNDWAVSILYLLTAHAARRRHTTAFPAHISFRPTRMSIAQQLETNVYQPDLPFMTHQLDHTPDLLYRDPLQAVPPEEACALCHGQLYWCGDAFYLYDYPITNKMCRVQVPPGTLPPIDILLPIRYRAPYPGLDGVPFRFYNPITRFFTYSRNWPAFLRTAMYTTFTNWEAIARHRQERAEAARPASPITIPMPGSDEDDEEDTKDTQEEEETKSQSTAASSELEIVDVPPPTPPRRHSTMSPLEEQRFPMMLRRFKETMHRNPRGSLGLSSDPITNPDERRILERWEECAPPLLSNSLYGTNGAMPRIVYDYHDGMVVRMRIVGYLPLVFHRLFEATKPTGDYVIESTTIMDAQLSCRRTGDYMTASSLEAVIANLGFTETFPIRSNEHSNIGPMIQFLWAYFMESAGASYFLYNTSAPFWTRFSLAVTVRLVFSIPEGSLPRSATGVLRPRARPEEMNDPDLIEQPPSRRARSNSYDGVLEVKVTALANFVCWAICDMMREFRWNLDAMRRVNYNHLMVCLRRWLSTRPPYKNCVKNISAFTGRVGRVCITPTMIERVFVSRFGGFDDYPGAITTLTTRTQADACTICLEEGEEYYINPCLNCHGMMYHISCLSRHLANKEECPTCRTPMSIFGAVI